MVALSATTNKEFTKFFNTFEIIGMTKKQRQNHKSTELHPNVEIVDKLSDLVVEAIKAFIKESKQCPTNVVIYRDGVGDSQIKDVHKQEVQKIRQALNTQFKLESIDLSVILTTKRINQRFFKKDRYQLGNPSNGLLVESVVVKEDVFDWFMLAQQVTEGCGTPTRF